MDLNGSQCTQMDIHEPKWTLLVIYGPKWSLVLNDPECISIDISELSQRFSFKMDFRL